MLLPLKVYDNTASGSRIKSFYKVTEIPSILIIDPVTGALMQDFKGFVEAERWATLDSIDSSKKGVEVSKASICH